jgi:hypothetical protein
MPDQKTCYLSDDSKGGAVQPKFVATNAGDLSAGTLYAAKLTQASPHHTYTTRRSSVYSSVCAIRKTEQKVLSTPQASHNCCKGC